MPLASSPTSDVPSLVFDTAPEYTNCAPAVFSWAYSGPNFPLSLHIIHADVPQNSTPVIPITTTTRPTQGSNCPARRDYNSSHHPPAARDPIAMLSIASTLDPTIGFYAWQQINVPQGWYTLRALISPDPPGMVIYLTQSTRFFVKNNGDISCLSVSSASPPSTSTGAATMSGANPSGISGTAPVSHQIDGLKPAVKGAIAGGIVGGVAILASIVAWLLYRHRRSPKTSRRWSKRAERYHDSQSSFGNMAPLSPAASWGDRGVEGDRCSDFKVPAKSVSPMDSSMSPFAVV